MAEAYQGFREEFLADLRIRAAIASPLASAKISVVECQTQAAREVYWQRFQALLRAATERRLGFRYSHVPDRQVDACALCGETSQLHLWAMYEHAV